jgi:hypothetical protein
MVFWVPTLQGKRIFWKSNIKTPLHRSLLLLLADRKAGTGNGREIVHLLVFLLMIEIATKGTMCTHSCQCNYL